MNYWDDGYPSGGNYWSDYTGEDLFSGPNQSIPGSDGIGDIPRKIPAMLPEYENYDFYPFMEPLDIKINIKNFVEIENIINDFTNDNNNEVLYQQSNSWWFYRFLQNHPRMFPILRLLFRLE
jgi:hypothetical protein